MTPTTHRVRSPAVVWPFEMWLGVAALYAGLSHFTPLQPTGPARAVDATFPRLALCWSALYALGGLAVALGLVRRSVRLESLGLHVLGSGLTVATIATLAAGAAILPTLMVQGALVVACGVRLWVLRSVGRA